jgi:ubiquinone/menaquinone biosynthesis C-methylase UbiE
MMGWNTERALKEIVDLYNFPRSGVIADLGAGDGALVAGLLTRYPELHAMVFESESVIEHTIRSIREHGLARRCEFVTGDFLRAVPAGADLYILKAIIHNWNDSDAVRILQNVRGALKKDGRLLIIERIPVADNLLGSAIRDLTMLVLFGGRDRSQDGYMRLLTEAQLEVAQAAMTPSGLCLIAASAT